LFILPLTGAVIGSVSFVAGCGSSQDGTSAQFDAKANLKQQDAMRAYMEKQKSGPGKAAKGKQ
jgi:hypothetical protein